ncbi:type I secretion system permease/ATPase [Sphingomonas sp.]|uniref:type I secretion system permease/ATPase n=1 Tax=Sphingomonas sp. TaxID=28214 RepID=UPI002ED8E572
MTNRVESNRVRNALQACRVHFLWAAFFSALINLLYLMPTLYMLQVYNRVVPTGGMATLVLLSVIGVLGLAVLSALEWLRSRLLVRASARFESRLAGPAIDAVLSQRQLSRLDRSEAMREFDTVRQALASPGMLAAMDAPWTPIYVIAAFLLHPALGALTVAGGVVLLGLAWANEKSTHGPLRRANDAANAAYANGAHVSAYASEVRALGMRRALAGRQLNHRATVSTLQASASFSAGNYGSAIKFIRLTLQSAALGLGAYLVVQGSMSGGAIMAASLLLSRALAPIEQVVGAWKHLIHARSAYDKLVALFAQYSVRAATRLPAPTGRVQVEQLTILTPQNDRVAVEGASFVIEPGEIIGVVGLSGAGKSTLLRALAGAAIPTRGAVRFDSASSQDWDTELLAEHVGYLPQEFVLFPGTIKDNISRFRIDLGEDVERIDAAVIEAAQTVGAHEMILRLPQGYDTPIGVGGVGLSAGQTQRIALARALFGSPRILILDEPNAHLDAEADHALRQLIGRLRTAGTTVILAAHSGDLLASVDKLLLLQNGRVARFGPISDMVTDRVKPVSHRPQEVAQ